MSSGRARRFLCVAMSVMAIGAIPALAISTFADEATSTCRDTGSRSVTAVELRGLKTTREEVVLRELRNRRGEPFTCAKWLAEKTRLEDLDIFADVRLNPVPGDSGLRLVYVFRELPPYIPFIAVAKTEQDGLSLGPALTSLNFLGRDIRAQFLSRFGGTTEFQASLSSLWLESLPLEYNAALIRIDSYNRFGAFHEDSWRAKLDFFQRVGSHAKLLYAWELFTLRADKPGVTLSGATDVLPRLGTGILWDGRDRRINPSRGFYQEARATQTGGWLGGPADYQELLLDSRAYFPWLSRNILLASGLYQYRTGTLGQSFGVYDLYHVGGINTLRGYAYDAFRGKSECILTVENRTELLGRRIVKLWRWSGYYVVQGVIGFESADLWNDRAVLGENFHSGMYGGMHLLIAGIDRIRLEFGSKTAKIEIKTDIGILDKNNIQRFRAR